MLIASLLCKVEARKNTRVLGNEVLFLSLARMFSDAKKIFLNRTIVIKQFFFVLQQDFFSWNWKLCLTARKKSYAKKKKKKLLCGKKKMLRHSRKYTLSNHFCGRSAAKIIGNK